MKEVIKNIFYNKNVYCFNLLTLFLFTSFISIAQDSSAVKIAETDSIKFQKFFFKSLSEKAKNEYANAIQALDECNTIIPNNPAVLFELSKNYYKLNRGFEAQSYANYALQQKPNNIWILEHLVKVYKKNGDFNDAISTQKKIISLFPEKKTALVYLYLQNKDTKNAKKILNELEKEKLLTNHLKSIKNKLNTNQNKTVTKKQTVLKNTDAKQAYLKDNSYANLKKLLLKLYKNEQADLLIYSEQGLSLYPAQPLIYLMHGRALLNNNKNKKAISSLKNGIDFVIDDTNLETEFYLEFIKAYTKIGDLKNSKKYKKKLGTL